MREECCSWAGLASDVVPCVSYANPPPARDASIQRIATGRRLGTQILQPEQETLEFVAVGLERERMVLLPGQPAADSL